MDIESISICGLCSKINHINSKALKLDLKSNTGLSLIQNKFNLCFPELDLIFFSKVVVCNSCIETIDTAYKFKMLCFKNESKLTKHMKSIDVNSVQVLNSLKSNSPLLKKQDLHSDPSVLNIIKHYCSEIKKKIRIEENNINLHIKDCFNTCRVCLQVINGVQTFPLNFVEPYTDLISIKNKLQLCCSELNLHLIRGAILCKHCLDIINVIYHFKNQCYKIEAEIRKFVENTNYLTGLVNSSTNSKGTGTLERNIKASTVNNERKNSHKSTNSRNPSMLKLKPKYKCTSCTCSYDNKNSLQKHMLVHENDRPFKCVECNYGANFKCNLKRHVLREHEGKSATSKHYNKKESVQLKPQRHKVINFSNNEIFKCPACNYWCRRKKKFYEHMLKHGGQNGLKCVLCDFTYKNKAYLKMHLSIHTDRKCFKCPHCSYSCNFKSNLNKHLINHKFKCKHCDFSSTLKSEYKSHLLTHNSNMMNGSPLKNDIQTYVGPKKSPSKSPTANLRKSIENPFQCHLCEYICQNKASYMTHQSAHFSDKALECTQCKYRTLRKDGLQRHLLVHSDERPFKCTLCNFSAKEKYLLKRHEVKH